MDKELKYLLALNSLVPLGAARLGRILEVSGSPEAAWRADLPELMSSGLSEKIATEIIISRSAVNPDSELEKMVAAGIGALASSDNDYPKNLLELHQPPPVIFYRGDTSCLNKPCLAVVGARKHTAYGQAAAEKIVAPLSAAGITIVSGLALGIDAIAHAAALKAKGKTAAVLGSDLDWRQIGPKTNFRLAEEIIASGGCLISEYNLGTAANRQTFPQRNRIISGLSRGVLVVEAGESSGSLITANYALEQNRDIYAIPDSIFSPYSAGCNNLIKRGARLVTDADDILGDWLCLETLKLDKKDALAATDDLEKAVLEQLAFEPLHLDKIAELTNTKINVLSGKLMLMELKGLVKSVSGGKYMII